MKSKLFAFLLIFLIVGCGGKDGPVIDIYHTNDIQGFYWPRPYGENDNKLTGGLAALKNMLASGEDKYLLFDSGDSFSKTQEGQINKLEGAIKLFNKLKYTAVTLSAADLSLGWDIVEPALALAQFPVVISNLKNADGSAPRHIKPYIIVNINKTKVAVLGLVSKADFPAIQRNAGIKVTDEVESLKEILPKVQAQNPDIIILLSSLGFEVESAKPRTDEKTIAEEFAEINLILGGNGDISADGAESISGTIITRSKTMLSEVDLIRLFFNKHKQISSFEYKPLNIDAQNYGEDSELKEIIDGMRNFVSRRKSYKIAQVNEELSYFGDRPSQIGEYAAQCIRTWGKTEAGIVNSDAFLGPLPEGAVTDASLHSIIPFADRVMFIKIRGDELKNALEYTLDIKNNWPQIAGMQINYDLQAPSGSKIKSILINGQKVQGSRLYSIAVTDHIVAGGFGHDEFLNVFEFKNTDRTLRDIVRWCLSRQREISAPVLKSWKAV